MELEVQEFLREKGTLQTLQEIYGIKHSASGTLVVLNYNQIESPKMPQIVRECRGLVLETYSWDVVAQPFLRFFNHGEALELTKDFDFENAYALEKLDGSIIQVFSYKDIWHMSTRGTIDGTGNVDMLGFTFKDLFDKTIVESCPDFWKSVKALGTDYTYIFELTAPENRIVTPYSDRRLTLIGVRHKQIEVSYTDLQWIASEIEVPVPKRYSFQDLDSLLKLHDDMGVTEEGFVCVDYQNRDDYGNFDRVKVKNPKYVAIAHMKDSATSGPRALLQLVIQGEQEEFLSYFPEYKKYTDIVSKVYEEFLAEVDADIASVSGYLSEERTKENRKQFAAKAKATRMPGFVFNVYYGKANTAKDNVQLSIDLVGLKLTAKNLLKTLSLRDLFQREL